MTKQILKEATENILSAAALGEPELTQSWAKSCEDIRETRRGKLCVNRAVRRDIFQEALTWRREGFGDQDDFSV